MEWTNSPRGICIIFKSTWKTNDNTWHKRTSFTPAEKFDSVGELWHWHRFFYFLFFFIKDKDSCHNTFAIKLSLSVLLSSRFTRNLGIMTDEHLWLSFAIYNIRKIRQCILDLWQLLNSCTFLLVGLATNPCLSYILCLTPVAPFRPYFLAFSVVNRIELSTMSHSTRPTFLPVYMLVTSKTLIF